MADETKLPAKVERDVKKSTGKPNAWSKFLTGLKSLPQRIAKSVMNTVAELKKCSWPSRKDLITYSLVVLVFMVALGVVVGVLDLAASALVQALINL